MRAVEHFKTAQELAERADTHQPNPHHIARAQVHAHLAHVGFLAETTSLKAAYRQEWEDAFRET